MLVGNANITVDNVSAHASSVQTLFEYSDSLIPREYANCKGIRDNQRYLCCVLLRKSTTVSWDHKKKLLNEAMPQIRVSGLANSVLSVDILKTYANQERLNGYLNAKSK